MSAVAAAAVLLAATAAVPPAGGAEGLFQEGVQRYEAGDFGAAAEAFQRILDGGIENPIVYYNLGNSRFHEGRIGEAILAWERALRLDPRDAEAAENRAYALGLTVDRVEIPEPSFPVRVLRGAVHRTTAEEDAWLLLLALHLLGAVGAWSILSPGRRLRRPRAYLAVALGLLAAASTTSLLVKEAAAAEPRAVVLAEKADVRSGPSEEGTALFTVHEGLPVQVRNRRGGWSQILLPNGLNGWVPDAAIGVVR